MQEFVLISQQKNDHEVPGLIDLGVQFSQIKTTKQLGIKSEKRNRPIRWPITPMKYDNTIKTLFPDVISTTYYFSGLGLLKDHTVYGRDLDNGGLFPRDGGWEF